MELLEDKNKEYKRYRPSPAEKIKIAKAGLQWVLSSNVSAVGTVGNDLVIRFINASLYQYPNQAKLFDAMLASNSKGHFVWVKLRKPKVAYMKIGSLPLENDAKVSDDELMKLVDDRGLATEIKLRELGIFIADFTNTIDFVGLNALLG